MKKKEPIKIYFAAPLFTAAERLFNTQVGHALEARGYRVWLPQDKEPRNATGRDIFNADIAGLEWCDVVVACMDGPDPDSGTCFECGYAFAKGKKILQFRSDFRSAGDSGETPYNLMLSESATIVAKCVPIIERVIMAIDAALVKVCHQ